ncbi:MAG: NAD(P)-dependent oxidoreductase, partial [Candidatus Eremiobacterota bacterium]
FFNIAKCSDMFGKMIYFGSAAEYDRRYCINNMAEEYFDTHIPVDDYGFAKYIMTKYAEKALNIYNLRLFSVFGKYENWDIRFISNAICKTLFNLSITIKQNALYHYLYINDLIPVIEYFIHHTPEYKVYNIIPDETASLYTLAEKIKIISKKDVPIKIAREGMGKVYTGNNSRLKKEMAHIKFTPLDCSIKELYNWYSDNINMIDKKLLLVDK